MEQNQNTRLPKPYYSWSKATSRFGLKAKPPPPIVSAPFGPVKSSRGPDLRRSDTLIIVDGISECSEAQPTGRLPAYSNIPLENNAILHSGKIMASTPAGYSQTPPAGRPTTEKSDITVTNSIRAHMGAKPTAHVRFQEPSRNGYQKPVKATLKTSSTVALLPQFPPNHQDENTPPNLDHEEAPSSKRRPLSGKLTKSRTMSVLHELKTSISRASLKAPIAPEGSGKQEYISPNGRVTDKSSSRLKLPQFSQPSIVTQTCPIPYNSHDDPYGITGAQPSAYWSGRFVSLYDKLASECLSPEPLGTLASVYKQGHHTSLAISPQFTGTPKMQVTYLPHASTTTALTSIMHRPPTPPSDQDEDRCQRVFERLEAYCCTQEARDSLHSWQQDYARRHNKPGLLPKGGTMEPRGRLMSKWFGSQGKTSGKRVLSELRESPNARLAKKISTEGGKSKSNSIRGSISKPIGPLIRTGGQICSNGPRR